MIQFLLDDVQYDAPKGWEEIETTIKRDFQYNSVLANQDTEVTFTGDAYDYLSSKLNSDGFCTKVKFVIQYSSDDITYQTLLRGNLFLSDCEFNERTCEVTCKIEDNSYFAMINNNKSLETTPLSAQSKNGVAIQAPPVYAVDFLNIVSLGVSRNVNCYRVYDLFEYLIAFMSDGKLQFKSDYLQTTSFPDYRDGDVNGYGWKGLCVTTGINIRNGNSVNDFSQSQFSFDSLFKEINRRIPLVLIVENPYSENPTIRIENRDYQYTNATIFTASDVYEIKRKIDTKNLYASVEVGSSTTTDQGLYPEAIHFFGFQNESYIVQGDCNIDTKLELGTDWITSSNCIAQQLNGLQDYDSSLFLVETEYLTATTGTTWNWNNLGMIGPPVYYYFNTNLTNNYILNRYRGGFPGDLRQFTGPTGDGLMSATELTSYAIPAAPSFVAMNFTNVITNNGGYWNGTDRYTAPLAGVYTFRLKGSTTSAGYTGPLQSITITLRAFIYDAVGTVQSNNLIGYISTANQATPNDSFDITTALILNDGWYVRFIIFGVASIPAITASVNVGSSIECFDNTIGGGLFVEVNTLDTPIYTFEFEYPMCQADFDAIMANTVGLIQFNMDGQAKRYGWINELTYNHMQGMASIKLISKNNGN